MRRRLANYMAGELATRRGLPPGVRQSDCDGAIDRFADFTTAQLWNACDFAQQELLSSRFAEGHWDLLRDALLDDGVTAGAGCARLGGLLWPAWIRFRDRNLREMLQRGEIPAGRKG